MNIYTGEISYPQGPGEYGGQFAVIAANTKKEATALMQSINGFKGTVTMEIKLIRGATITRKSPGIIEKTDYIE